MSKERKRSVSRTLCLFFSVAIPFFFVFFFLFLSLFRLPKWQSISVFFLLCLSILISLSLLLLLLLSLLFLLFLFFFFFFFFFSPTITPPAPLYIPQSSGQLIEILMDFFSLSPRSLSLCISLGVWTPLHPFPSLFSSSYPIALFFVFVFFFSWLFTAYSMQDWDSIKLLLSGFCCLLPPSPH